MKVTFLATFLFLLCTYSISAQDEVNIYESPKHSFGISMEANYGFFGKGDLFCEGTNCLRTNDGFGFALGILYQYQMNPFLAIRPQALLSLGDMDKRYFNEVDSETFEGGPAIVIPIHLLLKNPKWKNSPHLIAGGRYALEFHEREGFEAPFNMYDLAIDAGIGYEWTFSKFRFSSELVSSFGLVDVVDTNSIADNTNRNSVALRFVFRG